MNSRVLAVPLVAACALVTGCVDGRAPTSVETSPSMTFVAVPRLPTTPPASVVASLDRGRLVLVDLRNDSIIARDEAPIDPSQSEWVFEFTLKLPGDAHLELRLDVELIDSDRGVEVVEFSGRSTFTVQASFEALEIREVNLGRGPLANLMLRGLTVGGARSRIQEGGTDLVTIDTVGAAPGQQVYFHSSDPVVASVDSTGSLRALTPGRADIVAWAGRVADTLRLEVGEVRLPSPTDLRLRLVSHADYVTSDFFLRTLSDEGAARRVADAITVLVEDMLAGRGPEAVGRFEAAEDLWWAYGEGTELRILEEPQLSVIELTLMHASDALGIDF